MFSDPVTIIQELPILAGSKVADLGAGSGAYSFAFGKKVKKSNGGMVYAIDVQKDLLERIEKEAESQKISTIQTVLGDIEKKSGTRLRDGSIDIAVIANTLFQTEDSRALAEEAHRVLKEKGVLLVVDWVDSFGGMGPHEDSIFSKERAVEIFGSSGFRVDREIDAGEHHWGVVFKKIEK